MTCAGPCPTIPPTAPLVDLGRSSARRLGGRSALWTHTSLIKDARALGRVSNVSPLADTHAHEYSCATNKTLNSLTTSNHGQESRFCAEQQRFRRRRPRVREGTADERRRPEDALNPPDSRLWSPRRSQASVRPGVAAPQEHAPASCFTTVPSSYPRSPSTRRRRVCSTAWRPAYAVAAASCRWPRLLVPVAPARWRGGRRVRFSSFVATRPHLTRSCPRRREEEDRQGARHDRVPQMPRQLVLQLG